MRLELGGDAMAEAQGSKKTGAPTERRTRGAGRTTAAEGQPLGAAGGGLDVDPTAPATAPAAPPKRTGSPKDAAAGVSWAQKGKALTTAHGTPVEDTDNSLRVSSRGPTLLEDHHLREKIMHFDHERIPERVVHARGAVPTAGSSSTSHSPTSRRRRCSPTPRW